MHNHLLSIKSVCVFLNSLTLHAWDFLVIFLPPFLIAFFLKPCAKKARFFGVFFRSQWQQKAPKKVWGGPRYCLYLANKDSLKKMSLLGLLGTFILLQTVIDSVLSVQEVWFAVVAIALIVSTRKISTIQSTDEQVYLVAPTL